MNQANFEKLAEQIAVGDQHLRYILEQLKSYIPEATVWAFGSRVKHSHRPTSDLDLAILCDEQTAKKELPKLNEVFIESDLPFKVQLLDFNRLPENMRENIKKNYVVLHHPQEKIIWRDGHMVSEKEVALYYPYIDINDQSLIKTAALYWDEIQTIVPESVTEPYKTVVAKDAFTSGFLKPRTVASDDVAVNAAGAEFASDIEQEDIKQNLIKVVRKNIRQRQVPGQSKFSKLYFDKWMPLQLMKVWLALKDEIAFTPSLKEEAFYVPAPLAYAYMSRLASVICEKDNTVPLTNISSYQDLLIDRFVDYSRERKHNQSELVKLSLQTITVNPDVPLAEILEFRIKYKDDLTNYRRKISELVCGISKGLNTSEKQSLFEEMLRKQFLPAKEQLEAKLSKNTEWFMISNMLITLPTIGAISLSDGQAWLASLLTGTAALALNFWGNIRQDRNVTSEHPFGYLYQAQKKFGVNK